MIVRVNDGGVTAQRVFFHNFEPDMPHSKRHDFGAIFLLSKYSPWLIMVICLTLYRLLADEIIISSCLSQTKETLKKQNIDKD